MARWVAGLRHVGGERSDGSLAYAFAGLGFPLGAWLASRGRSWTLYAGPLLLGSWAIMGAAIDLWERVQWRAPVRWGVFIPYVGLYFWAQMFL